MILRDRPLCFYLCCVFPVISRPPMVSWPGSGLSEKTGNASSRRTPCINSESFKQVFNNYTILLCM